MNRYEIALKAYWEAFRVLPLQPFGMDPNGEEMVEILERAVQRGTPMGDDDFPMPPPGTLA